MGPTKAWTNNRIEPLSGDPLSGFDCTYHHVDRLWLPCEHPIGKGPPLASVWKPFQVRLWLPCEHPGLGRAAIMEYKNPKLYRVADLVVNLDWVFNHLSRQLTGGAVDVGLGGGGQLAGSVVDLGLGGGDQLAGGGDGGDYFQYLQNEFGIYRTSTLTGIWVAVLMNSYNDSNLPKFLTSHTQTDYQFNFMR